MMQRLARTPSPSAAAAAAAPAAAARTPCSTQGAFGGGRSAAAGAPSHAARHKLHRDTAAAAAGASPSPQRDEPGRGSSSSSDGNTAARSAAAWGSSWSKRPASVFKQQQQQEQQQQPSERAQPPPPPPQQQQQQQPPPGGASSADPAAAYDPALEASIRANVERAATTLSEIVDEVLRELLGESASAYVLGGGEEEGTDLGQIVRGAVAKRLEWLDANFLAAVNAYLALPGVRADPQLAALLAAVRTETLQLVSARLPAPVQVLNEVLQHAARDERAAVLTASLSGGRGSVPGCSLGALGAAAHQLIDDMEEQQVVADRVLLARLVLVREELRALAEQQSASDFWRDMGSPADGDSSSSGSQSTPGAASQPAAAGAAASGSSAGDGQAFFAFHRSNLPARCAAFLKNLLAVSDRTQRLGLLNKTFAEDWVAEAPTAAASSAAAAGAAAAPDGGDAPPPRRGLRDINAGGEQQQRREAPDIVRPGRLLVCLHAMAQEMEQQVGRQQGGGGGGPDVAEAMGLLQRLDAIKAEALVALDRVQQQGGGGGSSDYEADLAARDAAMMAGAAAVGGDDASGGGGGRV